MGLPADDLCLENAVVLERFSHRFPLVVDPAGQATRFLLNKYKVILETMVAMLVCLKNGTRGRRAVRGTRHARRGRPFRRS